MLMAEQNDLIVTIPAKAAQLQAHNPRVVVEKPPFEIPPIALKMAWSPLLQKQSRTSVDASIDCGSRQAAG